MAQTALKFLKKAWRQARAALPGRETGWHAHGEGPLNSYQKFIHFWALAGRGFLQNRCPVRASALAYTTLLALIPLLSVAVSISTGLLKTKGDQAIEVLIEQVVKRVAPQLDLVPKAEDEATGRQQVVRTISESIQKINSGTLGATGMIGLVVVVIMLLSTIETTFNDIWGVTRGRTWVARIIQYWAAVTLGPLIPVLAVAVNAGSHLDAVEKWVSHLTLIGQFLVDLIPFLVLSGAFGLFYQLMPHTRVRWQAALVGGIVGGTLWQANTMFNVHFISRMVTNYTTIYGPLSLVPVFLVGLYFSWLILLFGAQVAYTFQNRKAYLQQRQVEKVNQLGREFVALRIITLVGQKFDRSQPLPTAIELGQDLAVPTHLVAEVIRPMVDAGLLLEVEGNETAYTVGRPMDKISCGDILLAVRRGQGKQVDTREDPARNFLKNQLQHIQAAEQGASSKVTLALLVRQAPSPIPNPQPGDAPPPSAL